MKVAASAMKPGQAACGAKTRKNLVCKDVAMANGRCKRHGGKATGAHDPAKGLDNGAAKFGIYSRYLSAEDQGLYDEVALGSVDLELRLVRVRLARTVKAREAWEASLRSGDVAKSEGEGSHVLVEVVDDESVTKDGDVVPTTKRIKRLPDFDDIEHRCLARIESLEKTRKELLKDGGGEDPDTDPNDRRDKVTFTGGLSGGDDEELPSPFAKPAK